MSEQIEIMYGNATWRDASSRVNTWVFQDGDRRFPNTYLTVVGRLEKIIAHSQGFTDHGHWYKQRLLSQDGTVMYVQVRNTAHGAPYQGAGLLLRLRSTGPMMQISATITRDRSAVYNGSLPVFVGRADRLSLEEAQLLGAHFNGSAIDNYLSDEEEFEEVFDIVTLQAEADRAPEIVEVEDDAGEVTGMAIASAPGRRVRIRPRR